MKFSGTLQFRLSALVFAFGFLLIVMAFARQYVRDAAAQREKVRLDAYTEGTRLSGLAQHFLRKGLQQAADLAITYASVQPDLRLGVMCDGTDIIRHSTYKQWSGMKLWDTPLAKARPMVEWARKNMKGQIQVIGNDHRLVAVFPFWDVMQGMSRGVVILDYDLERPVQLALNRTIRESASQACALLGGCMLLWALLHVLVTERVVQVLAQARRIGWTAEPPAPLGGHDELALISQGIADAVQHLRKTELKFGQLASSMRDVFWIAPAAPSDPPYANPSYAALFGRALSELERRHWDWLRPLVKEDRRKAMAMLQELRKSPGKVEIEIRLIMPSGQIRWMRCRGFSTQQGAVLTAPLQVAGVVMEITERKEMERRLLQAAEHERRRIGQDLHDDVCQRLSAAQLKSGVLRAALKKLDAGVASLAGEVAQELAEATDVARRYARGLAPVAVGAAALPDALQDMGQFLTRAFGIKCRVSCEPLDDSMEPGRAALIYRIIQELATNAAKHSGATGVEINLVQSPERLWLEVSHDGTYFDPTLYRDKEGMGLHLVQQRVDALGASLSFIPLTVDRKGTIAICEIPI